MKYDVISTPNFERDIKFYIKKRKYKKILDDIEPILLELEKGILLGDEVQGLGTSSKDGAYKIRAVNSSAKVGKSNGFRDIYYAVTEDNEIYLLTIYSKKDKETISNKQIQNLINQHCK